MHCFNHPEVNAVGLCKECQRGLCVACATDLGHGLACKGVHEDAVETLHRLIAGNAKIQAVNPKAIFIAPLFYLFMGAMFIVWGLTSKVGTLFIIFGAGFIVFAFATFFMNRRAYVQNEPVPNNSLKADPTDVGRP